MQDITDILQTLPRSVTPPPASADTAAADVAPVIASGDLDGDNDIDLVVHDAGAVRIWRNDGGNAHRSVRVALTGRTAPDRELAALHADITALGGIDA